jgi:hypothetical protein
MAWHPMHIDTGASADDVAMGDAALSCAIAGNTSATQMLNNSNEQNFISFR